jgi:hypothetical protein
VHAIGPHVSWLCGKAGVGDKYIFLTRGQLQNPWDKDGHFYRFNAFQSTTVLEVRWPE